MFRMTTCAGINHGIIDEAFENHPHIILNTAGRAFININMYDPATGASSLTRVAIAKSNHKQRAERAGREDKDDACFCLYTEATYESLEDLQPSELRYTDFTPTMLTLLSLQLNPFTFPFIGQLKLRLNLPSSQNSNQRGSTTRESSNHWQ